MRTSVRNVCLFMCTVGVLFLCKQAVAESIVDYYNLLPERYLKGQGNVLVQKGKLWVLKSAPDYGEMEAPLVDLKNGYIKTVYHGGDGNEERVVALFLKTDKTPVVGIWGYYDGTGGDYYIYFLEYKNKNWKDVTGTVLPAFRYKMFLDENFDAGAFEQVMGRVNTGDAVLVSPQFNCTLPRTGTTVTVAFHLKVVPGMDFSDADKKVIADLQAAVKNKEMALEWNIQKGVFEILKKK